VLGEYGKYGNGEMYGAVLKECLRVNDEETALAVINQRGTAFKIAKRDTHYALDTEQQVRRMFNANKLRQGFL